MGSLKNFLNMMGGISKEFSESFGLALPRVVIVG
jgi:hypothetical protein